MTRSDLSPIQSFFSSRFPTFWDDEDWPFLQSGRSLEVFETDNEIVVKAPIPGVSPDEVNVTFEDGVLRISAKHEESEEEKQKKKVVYQAHRSSAFNYQTTLPRMIDPNNVKAEVEHGIITVSAPISEAAKLKKIEVSAKGK